MKHFGDTFIISRRREGFVEIVDKRTGVLQKIPQNDFDSKYGYIFENKNTLSIPRVLSLSERLALDPNWLASLRTRRILYVREKVSSNRKKSSRTKRSSQPNDPGGEGSPTPKRTRKASAKALLALERSVGSIGSSAERTEEQKRAAAEILRLFKL